MSGIDVEGSSIRKGATEAVIAWVREVNRNPNLAFPRELDQAVEKIAKSGGTPLAVAKDGRMLGVIHLKDIVKGGIRERFAELREMGIGR